MSFSLEGNEITLWRNYDTYQDGEKKSAADDSYRLVYSADSEGIYESLLLHEAMFRIVAILAEATESISEDSSYLAISKSQLLALSTAYGQLNSSLILSDLSKAFDDDILSFREQLKKNNLSG